MRARSLFVALLVAAAVAAPAAAAGREPRIVGGDVAPSGAYPWMVWLTMGGNQFCGGSLIASDTVLTAAHCTAGLTPDEMQVAVGREQLSDESSGQVIDVIGYAEYPGRGDAAILRLAQPVEIDPVGLATPEQAALYAPGGDATAVGWGLRREYGYQPSDNLREVDVPIVSDRACARAYGHDVVTTSTEICAGAKGRDTCAGDSGGPLLVWDEAGTPFQVGITSFGHGCARARYPGVYTEVPAILDFLTDPDPVYAPEPGREAARIDGKPRVGERLHCDEGSWTGEGIEFHYEWQGGFDPDPRSRKRGFTVPAGLAGKKITCSVTATTAGGSVEIGSLPERVHGRGGKR
jgi:secreted trypsin-like serine protease